MDKETIKKLYLLQVQENGISQKTYDSLISAEKALFEEKNNHKYYLKNENRKQIKVVMTGGAFDILHMGHVYTLSEAKKLGDLLAVSVARDEVILKKKGKLINNQKYRARMVEFLKPVDIVLLGIESPEKTLERVQPNVIVYGYDQTAFLNPPGVKVVKLKEHFEEKIFKTSRIIRELGL